MASCKGVNVLFKQQMWKQPKLLEMDKALYRLLTAICSKGKPVPGSMITEYRKSSTDKCMLPVAVTKNYPSVQPTYCLIIRQLSVQWVPD